MIGWDNITDVDLDSAGWPTGLGTKVRPELARKVLHTVPFTFAGVAVACAGVNWTFERRKKVAAAEGREPAAESHSEGGQETDSE